jgi:hypothetical protein
MNRNQIINAVVALIAAGGRFKTVQREEEFWRDVADGFLPLLFVRSIGEIWPPRRTGMPVAITLKLEAWIFTKGFPGYDQALALEDLCDQMDATFRPPAITLGGLVSHVWIQGEPAKAAGSLTDAAVAIFPLRVLVGGGDTIAPLRGPPGAAVVPSI